MIRLHQQLALMLAMWGFRLLQGRYTSKFNEDTNALAKTHLLNTHHQSTFTSKSIAQDYFMRDKSAASAGLSDAMGKCNLPEKYRCGELQGNSKRGSGAAVASGSLSALLEGTTVVFIGDSIAAQLYNIFPCYMQFHHKAKVQASFHYVYTIPGTQAEIEKHLEVALNKVSHGRRIVLVVTLGTWYNFDYQILTSSEAATMDPDFFAPCAKADSRASDMWRYSLARRHCPR